MHDIRAIRADAAAFDAAMARRAKPAVAAEILDIDRQRKAVVSALENAQAALNDLSKRIGLAKRAAENTAALEDEGRALRASIAEQKTRLPEIEQNLDALLSELPNILDADVPEGRDETANVEQKSWGEQKN